MLRQFWIDLKVRVAALFSRGTLHSRAEEELRFHLRELEERKIESAFQVMHPRFQKTFTVQAHPEADRTRALKRRERRLRKIDLRLGRLQVDVAKHDRARHGLFHHLCSPSCLRARVKSFPPYESEFFEGENHAAEIIPGTTEGMVIVVCPAESEPILPLFLILRSAITAFPV